MLRHLKSLIKISLVSSLIFTNFAYAEEIDTKVSGFVTGTYFSDPNWFSSTGNIAVNLDVSYDTLALRGQVATEYENKIRRLAIEKTFYVNSSSVLIVQLGRSPRLTSFYNTINDAPGTTGMAMLPLGGFSHRMVENSTLNSIDGIKAIYNIKTENGVITINGDYGILPLENQCGIQAEAAFSKCRAGYEFEPVKGSYDLGISYEIGSWITHGYFGSTKLKTTLLDPKDKTSVYLTSNYSLIEFDIFMVGVKYNKNKWLFQTDYLSSKYNTAKLGKELITVGRLSSFYVLGSYNWNDQFSTYATFSRSLNNGAVTNVDRSIGATYVRDNTTISLDYHVGHGYGWQPFFSPVPGWSSWVLSATQRF